jgi:hypothetical protein
MVSTISEKPVTCIFKVDVSRTGIWVGYTGMVEGLEEGKQEDWPIRARDKGEETEPYLVQQETGNKKIYFQGQCTENNKSSASSFKKAFFQFIKV